MRPYNEKKILEELNFWDSLPLAQDWKKRITILTDKKNFDDLNQRFLTENLHFGTAGIRAIMDIGNNYLNPFTIIKITLGLCHFLWKDNPTDQENQKIVIGYDSRHHSYEFASLIAQTLLFSGFYPILFSVPCPSPVLSYTTKYYKASAGIMITASHNPKEYNGYKIYNHLGGQFLPQETQKIAEFIKGIPHTFDFKTILKQDITHIDTPSYDIFNQFFKAIKNCIPSILLKEKYSVPVIFSPFFGTAKGFAENMIAFLGGKLIIVEEENHYDGDFGNSFSPNPEEKENFTQALKYAKQYRSSICILTDPDSDRLGVWEDGYFFNGNELGTLLSYFLASHKTIYPDTILASSIVSTQLSQYIAQYWNIEYQQTLTGFKYIGEIIKSSPENFLLGFEESYGYLIGPYIQDKDAIGALALIYVMVNHLYDQNQTLLSYLETIYETIGFSKTDILEQTLQNTNENQYQQKHPSYPQFIGNLKILEILDFQNQIHIQNHNMVNNYPFKEKTNLIVYKTDHYIQIAIRPSGTEPKVKIYIELLLPKEEEISENSQKNYLKIYEDLIKKIKNNTFFQEFIYF